MGFNTVRRPRRSGRELGRMHHQRLRGEPRPHPRFQPHPLSSTRPHNLREAILREIDKESIRQEIIMSEITRRHAFALESELRYEMMMERARAMALQRGRNWFPSESPRPLAEMVAEGRFLEERIMFPPPPRNALNNWREGGGSEAIPLQRAPIDERMARLSEVETLLEASSEKNKMISQAKPIMNITGAKKARAGSQSDGNSKKKVKEEWNYALCQVNKRNPNMHLAGKKHKRVEAALNARSKPRMPLSEIKVANSLEGSENANPATNSEVKLTSESLLLGTKAQQEMVRRLWMEN